MSEWITDREPTKKDAPMNYIIVWEESRQFPFIIDYGDWHKRYPWMPIEEPEPYVAPSRYTAVPSAFRDGEWVVEYDKMLIADNIPTRETAERIAAIYNEVWS